MNLPAEWETKATSGFDRLKMEALDFGAWSRNLDLARTAIEFPLALGWPRDSVRHLVPVFRSGCAWEKEIAHGNRSRNPGISICGRSTTSASIGLPPTPGSTGRSQRF